MFGVVDFFLMALEEMATIISSRGNNDLTFNTLSQRIGTVF